MDAGREVLQRGDVPAFCGNGHFQVFTGEAEGFPAEMRYGARG